MEKERYENYIKPDGPHITWSEEQLFDEVDFLTTHRFEIHPTGERDAQLKKRMAQATLEQSMRYAETHV